MIYYLIIKYILGLILNILKYILGINLDIS